MPQREHRNIQGDSSPDPPNVIISFDELAKGLATGAVSRRKALRWMGGALVGAALTAVPRLAWADDDRCSEGQTRCGERCVNLKTNERHCGSCRNRCGSNQTCCGGRCVNLQRNERHCGRCGKRCAQGEECVGGVCEGGGPAGCTPGTIGECGSCTHFDGETAGCHCATLADGTGTFCFFGGFCESSCADCDVLHPGTVCVQYPPCNSPVACVSPCPNGGPCP